MAMLEALAAGSILLASTGGSVLPAWCSADQKPTVRVGLIATTPKSDFSKSTVQLEKFQIDTINPYGAQIDTHVGGLTSGMIRVEQKMSIGGVKYGQQVCMWPDEVNITIRLDQKVYVAKDYAPGSCLHDAVWEHEHKHVRVDREIINKWRPIFERAVKTALDRTPVVGPLALRDEAMAQKALMKELGTAIKTITEKMENDRNRHQQAIDTREEYDRVADLCRGRP
jgi:hypothetical protein